MVVPEPRFYLKNPKSTEPTLISLQAKFNGERVFMSTGDKVNPSEWDFIKQRAMVSKKNPGNSEINMWLDKIAAEFKALFRNLLIDGIVPTEEIVMKALREKLNRNVSAPETKEEKPTLLKFISQYIEECRVLKSANTVKSYVSTHKHMEHYFKMTGGPADFDSITIEWRNSFIKCKFRAMLTTHSDDIDH